MRFRTNQGGLPKNNKFCLLRSLQQSVHIPSTVALVLCLSMVGGGSLTVRALDAQTGQEALYMVGHSIWEAASNHLTIPQQNFITVGFFLYFYILQYLGNIGLVVLKYLNDQIYKDAFKSSLNIVSDFSC